MRKLESYIEKYGEAKGWAMYAHARDKKAIKNAAAVELGRKGGEARAKSLSKEELSKIGKAAAAKRWPEKGGKSLTAEVGTGTYFSDCRLPGT